MIATRPWSSPTARPACRSSSAASRAGARDRRRQVILYNNAQAVLRLRVKLLRRQASPTRTSAGYYDWNMANNPDPSIKGDMEIDARGATALLEKDVQNQATLNLANVTSNPALRAVPRPEEASWRSS
jgi:hypothetical protein